MQPRLFEEWIEEGYQRDTNLVLVRCLCTPHRQTLLGEGRRGVHPRLFCILCQGVWGFSCHQSLFRKKGGSEGLSEAP